MEYLAPLLGLLRDGSPWLVLLTVLGAIGISFIKALLPRTDKETGQPRTARLILGDLHDQRVKEVQERYAAEIATWAERYAEVDARRIKAEREREEAILRWLDEARRTMQAIRATQDVVHEVEKLP